MVIKQANYINRYLTKMIWISNKHRNKHLMTIAIWEIQIQTTIRQHNIPIKTDEI